jgi:hypothetical protein
MMNDQQELHLVARYFIPEVAVSQLSLNRDSMIRFSLRSTRALSLRVINLATAEVEYYEASSQGTLALFGNLQAGQVCCSLY